MQRVRLRHSLAAAVAFAAMLGKVQDMVLGEPNVQPLAHNPALLPVFTHLGLVLMLGLWMPPALADWYRLAARLKPFLLRRTKEQVATELPAKTEITHWVELTAAQRKQVVDYFALTKQEGTARGMLRGVLASTAALAIIPMADWLEENAAARMNTPGQARGNWQWCADAKKLTPALAAEIRVLTERYFRAAK